MWRRVVFGVGYCVCVRVCCECHTGCSCVLCGLYTVHQWCEVHMISICIYARHGRGPVAVARWPLVVVLVPDNLRSGVVAGR